MKRIVLAVLAVFVAWSAMDFVIHGLILASSYEATAQLWRPMNEMKLGVLHLAVLINALAFRMHLCAVGCEKRYRKRREVRFVVRAGHWFLHGLRNILLHADPVIHGG